VWFSVRFIGFKKEVLFDSIVAFVMQIPLQYKQSFEIPGTAKSKPATDPQKIRKKGEYTLILQCIYTECPEP
jgi:hypothetical protein